MSHHLKNPFLAYSHVQNRSDTLDPRHSHYILPKPALIPKAISGPAIPEPSALDDVVDTSRIHYTHIVRPCTFNKAEQQEARDPSKEGPDTQPRTSQQKEKLKAAKNETRLLQRREAEAEAKGNDKMEDEEIGNSSPKPVKELQQSLSENTNEIADAKCTLMLHAAEHDAVSQKNGKSTVLTTDTIPLSKPSHVVMTDGIIDQFKIIRNLPIGCCFTGYHKLFLGAPKRRKLTNKTLVFDLDETLVHTFFGRIIPNSAMLKGNVVHHVVCPHPESEGTTPLTVILRPNVIRVLAMAAQYFELILFTASRHEYANAVLEIVDPKGTLFDHRLYREHCVRVNNCCIKDLRILNRDLSSVIIVDNSVISFLWQLDNGIYIPSFTGDVEDRQLWSLWEYLKRIADVPDVRIPIRESYRIEYLLHDFLSTQQSVSSNP